MPSNLHLSSASNKCGNPIVLSVTPGTAPSDAIFHKINVIINVCASSADFGSGLDFKFSNPVSSSGSVEMDISSAIVSFLDAYEYSATSLTIPSAKFKASAYDEYMEDGEVKTSTTITATFDGPFSQGAYTDMERIKSDGFLHATPSTDSGFNYSRKPKSSPEILYKGDTFVYPTSATSSASIHLSGDIVPDAFPLSTHPAFLVSSNIPSHYQLRFVNGLGTIESISVLSFRKSELSITSQQYLRSTKSSSFSKPNGSYYVKQNQRETWTLSSGPLDAAWKQWFAHELLMTPQAWLLSGSTWLPIHIIPDETTELIDNTNQKPYTLQFKITFDLTGPIQ